MRTHPPCDGVFDPHRTQGKFLIGTEEPFRAWCLPLISSHCSHSSLPQGQASLTFQFLNHNRLIPASEHGKLIPTAGPLHIRYVPGISFLDLPLTCSFFLFIFQLGEDPGFTDSRSLNNLRGPSLRKKYQITNTQLDIEHGILSIQDLAVNLPQVIFFSSSFI